MKTALICGISGQDGTYLTQLLLEKGYRVFGTSRDAESCSFSNLHALGLFEKVNLMSMAVTDFRSVLQVIAKTEPDELYNLAGLSSVGLSFEQPAETLESLSLGTLNLLEAVRFVNPNIRIYGASSSECFGNTGPDSATELTAFRPRSPYAVAKSAAFWQIANYREAYGIYACSGILANHESPLRPIRFVTRKIVSAACMLANGAEKKLELGNLHISRDWGWAPEYVNAMWSMLQQPIPDDYIIATGKSHSLEEFVSKVFAYVGLDWREHVTINNMLFRPSDITVSSVNPQKARCKLEWNAKVDFEELVSRLVEAELAAGSAA